MERLTTHLRPSSIFQDQARQGPTRAQQLPPAPTAILGNDCTEALQSAGCVSGKIPFPSFLFNCKIYIKFSILFLMNKTNKQTNKRSIILSHKQQTRYTCNVTQCTMRITTTGYMLLHAYTHYNLHYQLTCRIPLLRTTA